MRVSQNMRRCCVSKGKKDQERRKRGNMYRHTGIRLTGIFSVCQQLSKLRPRHNINSPAMAIQDATNETRDPHVRSSPQSVYLKPQHGNLGWGDLILRPRGAPEIRMGFLWRPTPEPFSFDSHRTGNQADSS